MTRWTHSCVALEHDGHTLVIDPGTWTEPQALDGADAVLLTHDHGDHADVERLVASGLPVWAPRGSELGALASIPLDPGALAIAGFEVRAVAGPHAPVVAGQATRPHLGYVVRAGDQVVHHPGDGLTPPGEPVDVLLVPMQGSWLRTADAIEFVRTVAPGVAVGIHDGQLHDRGRAALNHWLSTAGSPYTWLAPGQALGEPAPPRVRQLRLVVKADDFESAARFYRDVLGLPVELELAGDRGEHVLILDAGRATLELSDPAQVAMIDEVEVGRQVAPRLRVAFEVDDAAAATETLVGGGAELLAGPTRTPWGSLNARLEAPADLQITLFEEDA